MMDKEKAIKYITDNPLNDQTLGMNQENYIKRINNGDYFHFCKKCGMIEFAAYMESTKAKLKEEQICFTCDFWNDILSKKDKHFFVKNNNGTITSYAAGGIKTGNTKFLGHGGSVFNYSLLNEDSVEVYVSNNVWCQGDVPKHFEDTLSENAVFLPSYIQENDYIEIDSKTFLVLEFGKYEDDRLGQYKLSDGNWLKIEPGKKRFMKSRYNKDNSIRTWIYE